MEGSWIKLDQCQVSAQKKYQKVGHSEICSCCFLSGPGILCNIMIYVLTWHVLTMPLDVPFCCSVAASLQQPTYLSRPSVAAPQRRQSLPVPCTSLGAGKWGKGRLTSRPTIRSSSSISHAKPLLVTACGLDMLWQPVHPPHWSITVWVGNVKWR